MFRVRFFPALCGALTLWLVWKSVEALRGGLFARILEALGFLFSGYLRINTIYQPNSVDILCWTFVFYALIRLIGTGNRRWLYGMGIGFGVGLLNKYNIGFLALGMSGALLMSSQRRWLREPAFYGMIAVALLIVSPNALWQGLHGFPVARHMEELGRSQLTHVDRIGFLAGQGTFFLPGWFLLPGAFAGFALYKPLSPYRMIGWTVLFVLGLYLSFRGKPYYALGLYPVMLAVGSTYLEAVTRSGRSRWLRPLMIVLIPVAGIFYIRASCPVYPPARMAGDASIREMYRKTGQLRWEDG